MPKGKAATENTGTLSVGSFPALPLSEVKRLRLFRGVPTAALAILEGRVRLAAVPQGETIIELVQSDLAFRYFFFR